MYIELHSRSAFSFLEGASLPEELVAVCANLAMPAMAMLDRDGLYSSPRFHLAAKKAKIKAHIGAEITCAALPPSLSGQFRLPLLVASRAGYQNLCRLITKMKLWVGRKEGASAEDADFIEHADGLICLTGGEEGPLAAALRQAGPQAACEAVRRLTEIFGRANVYVELQRHYHRDEEYRNRVAIQIAEALQLPLLATNGVNYASPRERELADAFTALRHHRTLATAGRLLARNAERSLKSPAGMRALFADVPQAITNTLELSSRLEFALNDLGYEFPRYPVPEGETMMSFLRERTREGWQSRYGRADAELKKRARRQIERELNLIDHLKLAGYFLIVWDIVRYCREQKILVQGRGSAANSAVCYSLGITAVDPIGMELLFERFLSEERGEWPDIDLDLPSGGERERVIQHVYQRYGQRGAAMTANVITYRNRMAAREMGKAMGFDDDTLKRISAAVATWEFKDEHDALDRRLCDAGLDLKHPRIRKYFELCLAARDLPRHLGQHSGGLVICQGQLDSIVPLEPATMPGRVVVQWDKDDCADMGIVKVDLLGLGMMAVLEDCLQIIKTDYGEEIDLGRLPADDPVVYPTLQKADTIGMFQVESHAQMACLPRLRPECFYDLVVQVAIIRPGPIVGKMVNPYLKRRQGREAVDFLHPSLKPVLERTLGVPLFQEQLLRMAMIAAGFTGGEAEELRRALGFKRSEKRMKEIEIKLRCGMDKNGVAPVAQEKIVQSITSFALYGFPESHAASFALLAYASAYLKCHYLAAFTAAILNNQPMGFYQPDTLVRDAQRHGLKVKPIDVTCSDWLCKLEKNAPDFYVRLGMRYVKGLRGDVALEIVSQRAIRPFLSIEDLKLRVPMIQKSELTTLAEVGALNFIAGKHGVHRRDALWQIERAARRPGPLLEETEGAEEEPINSSTEAASTSSAMQSPLAAMTGDERLVADFRGTGMTVGLHPMGHHRVEMKRRGVRSAIELTHLPDGMRVKIAGGVITRQRPGTAKGFVFLSLEDETGISNAIITPQLFEKYHVVIVHQQFLLVEGKLQNQDGVISVKAESIQPLGITRAETTSHDFH